MALPDFSFRPGNEGRQYRRDDSDEPGNRYRLYELAGVAHMTTRQVPFDDPALWSATVAGEADISPGSTMNSLPHSELFNVGLHHLVEWVANGTVPPRAERLEVGPDDYFAKDEHGNTLGGVRCMQIDVPHSTYRPNSLHADGTPSYITVGLDEPFDAVKMSELYGDHATYLDRFNRRLDELIEQGWFLADDAAGMRHEAQQIEFEPSASTKQPCLLDINRGRSP